MKIKNVSIHNFLSIENLTFNFTEGLHLFEGDNGVGKSSILQAVSVGLYNKCERAQPWARIGGPGGFSIEVEFTDVLGDTIKVINNRGTGRYEVFINDELETYQISKGLPIVAERLNISYHEFTMLSFLTPTTITNILTGTDSSLISKFFNLSILTVYEKTLMEERRVLNKENKQLHSKLAEETEVSSIHDVGTITKGIADIKNRQLELYSSDMWTVTIPEWYDEISKINEDIKDFKVALSIAEGQLRGLEGIDKVCPTCGSVLSDTVGHTNLIIELRDNIKEITKALKDKQDRHAAITTKINLHKNPIVDEQYELKENLGKLEGELIAANILQDRERVDTTKLHNDIADINVKVVALNAAIKAIKSGEVHKSYLQTFVTVLNGHLGKLTSELYTNASILAKVGDKGLSFSILDNGIYKFSDVLSAGERVIVGLLVLSAMFKTLKDTLNVQVNLLMLDEAVSAVSNENMHVVHKVLEELAQDRCVIVTQHHKELPTSLFNFVHTVSKVDNLTEIKDNYDYE